MKKWFFALLLLMSVVFASCYEYVEIAESRAMPPYPNYFGAAGEYMHAADCFNSESQYSLAEEYYEKAGDYFVLATTQLIEGGDNFQRAKSLEMAADNYLKAGLETKALNYYNKAKSIYEKFGYGEAVMLVDEKIKKVTHGFEWTPIIGFVSVLALIVSVLGIIYLLAKNSELVSKVNRINKKVEKEEMIVRRSREQFKAPVIVREKKPVKRTTLSPKEKLAKKLREKYMPK